MRIEALVLLVACAYAWGPADDIITNLPGIGNLNFKQYAGHINVNPATGRNLFYWFVESQQDPKHDPLIIWLNGGPGCSSLGGFMSELGPFWPTVNGSGLEINEWTWNKVANVIFLDSPSGVGFSYSTNTSDYHVGDARTANDTYNFLQLFLQAYPEFADNPFWVTGESYGGHYVPNLAARILDGNAAGTNPIIDIRGFMVGNAWSVAALDNQGAVFDWWSHALNSEATYQGMEKYCNWSAIGPYAADDIAAAYAADMCDQYSNVANVEMGNINIYQIYEDVCTTTQFHQGQQLIRALAKSPHRSATSSLAKALVAREEKLMSGDTPTPPCIDNYVQAYLNRADVRAAIHATMPKYMWADCNGIITYNYQDLLSSMMPVYQKIINARLQILVYSGDVDGIVPTPGTRLWLKTLNLTLEEPWRPWISSQQVGGYVERYTELTFATVRGAGHMVPGIQPHRAFDMFSRFLSGRLL